MSLFINQNILIIYTINTITSTLKQVLVRHARDAALLGVRLVHLGLGPALALQRPLLVGLVLLALDLANTSLVSQSTHTKTRSHIGINVDLAPVTSSIVFSGVNLPIPETDSYSEPATEQPLPLRH